MATSNDKGDVAYQLKSFQKVEEPAQKTENKGRIMQTLRIVNQIIGILFTLCYLYQFFYIPIPWFAGKKKKPGISDMRRCYAVLICARNEEKVIADLINSLRLQTYPSDKIHVFVLADNCTDSTSSIARNAGAAVYERRDNRYFGKGYALESLLGYIDRDYPDGFDGYFVFDADNVLKEDYIEQMDRVFSEGNDIVTSYRNSKNYADNWISAGYALWFLRESRYLNHARFLLKTSCAVSGTGFLVSLKVMEEIGGWPFHMLTEDIEFSIHQITNGKKIAFCEDAELFDEQPVTFSQSWHQRMRWARGYLQVFEGYGLSLVRGALKGSFSCFDMSMTIMPAFILSTISIFGDLALGIWGASIGDNVMIAVHSIGSLLSSMYLMLFSLGAVTTVTEWQHIQTSTTKKILYTFTFPLFMFTYIPISIAALFVNPGWKPIHHSVSFSVPTARINIHESQN